MENNVHVEGRHYCVHLENIRASLTRASRLKHIHVKVAHVYALPVKLGWGFP